MFIWVIVVIFYNITIKTEINISSKQNNKAITHQHKLQFKIRKILKAVTFYPESLVRTVELFYIFAALFNVWLYVS